MANPCQLQLIPEVCEFSAVLNNPNNLLYRFLEPSFENVRADPYSDPKFPPIMACLPVHSEGGLESLMTNKLAYDKMIEIQNYLALDFNAVLENEYDMGYRKFGEILRTAMYHVTSFTKSVNFIYEPDFLISPSSIYRSFQNTYNYKLEDEEGNETELEAVDRFAATVNILPFVQTERESKLLLVKIDYDSGEHSGGAYASREVDAMTSISDLKAGDSQFHFIDIEKKTVPDSSILNIAEIVSAEVGIINSEDYYRFNEETGEQELIKEKKAELQVKMDDSNRLMSELLFTECKSRKLARQINTAIAIWQPTFVRPLGYFFYGCREGVRKMNSRVNSPRYCMFLFQMDSTIQEDVVSQLAPKYLTGDLSILREELDSLAALATHQSNSFYVHLKMQKHIRILEHLGLGQNINLLQHWGQHDFEKLARLVMQPFVPAPSVQEEEEAIPKAKTKNVFKHLISKRPKPADPLGIPWKDVDKAEANALSDLTDPRNLEDLQHFEFLRSLEKKRLAEQERQESAVMDTEEKDDEQSEEDNYYNQVSYDEDDEASCSYSNYPVYSEECNIMPVSVQESFYNNDKRLVEVGNGEMVVVDTNTFLFGEDVDMQ